MSDEGKTFPAFVFRLRTHELMNMTRGDETFTSEDCDSYVLGLGEDQQDTPPVADIIVYYLRGPVDTGADMT